MIVTIEPDRIVNFRLSARRQGPVVAQTSRRPEAFSLYPLCDLRDLSYRLLPRTDELASDKGWLSDVKIENCPSIGMMPGHYLGPLEVLRGNENGPALVGNRAKFVALSSEAA